MAYDAELADQTDEVLIADQATLSILVIDDEEFVRETLADMLKAMSHKVLMAESGQEAIQKLEDGNFDLVFTDLAMPEMDGWETAREIRKRRRNDIVWLWLGPGHPHDGEAQPGKCLMASL